MMSDKVYNTRKHGDRQKDRWYGPRLYCDIYRGKRSRWDGPRIYRTRSRKGGESA